MPRLTYSGSYYYDGKNRFTAPGDYDVDDAKAEQLLRDFPDQFTAAEDSKKESEQSDSTPNLSKMNRAELEAFAYDIGMSVNSDMDTNKKLAEAIKAHQEEEK